MSFILSPLEHYIETHSTPEAPYLRELRREAYLHLLQPRMLTGYLQGQLLTMLVMAKRPRNVLEIGTYSGYSAICLARGLEESGCDIKAKVYTLEAFDECEDFIRRGLKNVPFSHRIELRIGKAEDLLPHLLETLPFDLVYIDANKRHYLNYYHLLIDALPQGAVVLVDNTLWSGKVIEEPLPHDEQTKAILAFNDFVAQDPRVEATILPLRDGLTMLVKLPEK